MKFPFVENAPSLKPENKTAQALNRAIMLIEQHGWFQGAHKGPDGSLCMGQAVVTATDEMKIVGLFDHVIIKLHKQIGPVALWNDVPGRTKEEVINMLRTTADLPN